MPEDVTGFASHDGPSGPGDAQPSPPAGCLPNRDRIRQAAEDSLAGCLRTIWIILAVIYVAFAAAHLWFLPESIRGYLFGLAAATSLAFALAALLSRSSRLPRRRVFLLGGLTALTLWLNSAIHLGLSGQPHETTNLIIVLIGTGMVILDRRWFFTIAALCIVAWMTAALIHSEHELWAHFGFALFSSSVLAGVVHFVRIRDLERIEGLRAIDARRQAELELALQDTRRQLASIWQNSRDGMVITDPDGRLVAVNRAAASAVGLDESQLTGRFWHSVFPHHLDPDAADRAYAQVLAHPAAAPADEFEVSLSDGQPRWVTLSHLALPQSDGPPHLLTLIRDLTHRRHMEEERREMEHRMSEAQRLESLGVLAGGIAHDFNNLLTAILGSLDLIRIESSSQAILRFLDRARTATQHAASLCRQMLAYAGRGRFVVLDADLNDAVRETVSLVTPSAPKSIRFELDLAPGLPGLHADISQLRQVLMNLALNAIEAIGSHPGRIRWITRLATPEDLSALSNPPPPSPSGAFLCLEVEDNGCGMDAQTRSRIFEPFFTTKFAGRGLGLAAVQGMVRSHSGALCVLSEPAVGTTFRLLFPALDRPVPAAIPSPDDSPLSKTTDPIPTGPGTAEPASSPTPPDLTPESNPSPAANEPAAPPTILLVDDESYIRELIALQLHRLDCQVLDAAEGEAALELLRHHPEPIDLVLLDLTMPGMDGAKTLRELRKLPNPPPVVLMSGYSADEIHDRFADDGLAGFLHKPFTAADLAAQVRRAIPIPRTPESQTAPGCGTSAPASAAMPGIRRSRSRTDTD